MENEGHSSCRACTCNDKTIILSSICGSPSSKSWWIRRCVKGETRAPDIGPKQWELDDEQRKCPGAGKTCINFYHPSPPTRQHVAFLKVVARLEWYHQGLTLLRSIRRHDEPWMPLILNMAVGSVYFATLPQIDAWWDWYWRTLNPVSYW